MTYILIDDHMIDKQLMIDPNTRLPWGLRRQDTPEAIRKALEGHVDAKAQQSRDRITVQVPGCEAWWLEVTLGPDQQIQGVGFNEQP